MAAGCMERARAESHVSRATGARSDRTRSADRRRRRGRTGLRAGAAGTPVHSRRTILEGDEDMKKVVAALDNSAAAGSVAAAAHFFFNDTATTEIYTLSLHDALPI